jgi:hypothetical protein
MSLHTPRMDAPKRRLARETPGAFVMVSSTPSLPGSPLHRVHAALDPPQAPGSALHLHIGRPEVEGRSLSPGSPGRRRSPPTPQALKVEMRSRGISPPSPVRSRSGSPPPARSEQPSPDASPSPDWRRMHEVDNHVQVRIEGEGEGGDHRQAALRRVFAAFDHHGGGGGTVDSKELFALGTARRSVGHRAGTWTEEMNRKLIARMDANGDGEIDEGEFVQHFNRALPQDRGEFEAVVGEFMEAAAHVDRRTG